MAMTSQTICPVVRADLVYHYCRQFQAMGAPTESLLERSDLRPELIVLPDALVPLRNAYRFAALACSSLQTEHLGVHVALASSLDDFGAYGHNLGRRRTLGDYLQKGVAYFNTLNSGENLWMSTQGADIRLNCASFCKRDLGAYQSHLLILIITVATVRKAAAPHWCPREIGLAYDSQESIPATDAFEESRIFRGLDYSYITIPRALLQTRLPETAFFPDSGTVEPGDPLPTEPDQLVLAQLDALSKDNQDLHIDAIATSLDLSRRSLQRALSHKGLSYQQILTRHRMEKAAGWLAFHDKSITEIALDLGYTDASNFTRAFRRYTGLSPNTYRMQMMRH